MLWLSYSAHKSAAQGQLRFRETDSLHSSTNSRRPELTDPNMANTTDKLIVSWILLICHRLAFEFGLIR